MSALEQCGQLFTTCCVKEGVHAAGSKAAHRPAQGTAYRLALQHLFQYHEDPAFLEWIVTGDKSWCHHYEPETKRDTMQWKHASSLPPKQCKAVASAGKVLLTVFFDVQGPLLVEFLQHRRTINSDVYCEALRSLRRSIKNKRLGLLIEGVVLLHDNAHTHISRVTHAELAKFKWEQLDHPPYSPDMSPWDFHVVWSPEKTSEREALQLWWRTQGGCEGLGLVMVIGILETRNSSSRSSMGLLCLGLWCILWIKSSFIPTVSFRTFSFEHPLNCTSQPLQGEQTNICCYTGFINHKTNTL